jgi:protease IV
MNQFIKFVFASCLGVAIAIVALGALVFFIGMGIAGSAGESEVKITQNTVLHLTFGQRIPEQTNNVPMSPFAFKTQKILGLNDICKALEHAAGDNKIKGIFLNMDAGLGAGIATAAILRQDLLKFRESGKFIVAYSKYYSQGAYYLSSAADKIYVNPMGGIDFQGFAAIMPFFKNMLDKIGVKMNIFYAGDFKGATEPYRFNKMSEQNRLQLREYLEPVYRNFLADMGKSRNIPVAVLRQISDELKLRKAEDAVTLGLADEVGYLDNAIADMKQRTGLGDNDKFKTVSLVDYAANVHKKKDYSTKNKIAVLYAEGAIYANKGERGTIVDNKYIKTIRKIRKDDKVKAIVLRVNSPGGSALASENIWRELTLAKEAGKKVVVSMGDYAASGGYYISCMGDKIVAEPNTLTGSIGVFSMLPNAQKLFEDKLGITWDTVKTTKHSTGLNPFHELDEAERDYLTEMTLDIYEKFLQRVGEGRNMSRDSVHRIAQGRIWTGTKAKEIGLVDEIGGLDRAIELAAELAGVDKYRVSEYPFQKEALQEFIDELTGQGDDDAVQSRVLQRQMGDYFTYYKQLREMVNTKGVQARLPLIPVFE